MKLITYGESRYRVELRIHETDGNGLCLFVSGGEIPHVGGCALAIPRQKSSGEGWTCDISTLCAPGHKDVILAQRLATTIAVRCLEVVSVTVGLHIENATEEELTLLTNNAMAAAELWLEGIGDV